MKTQKIMQATAISLLSSSFLLGSLHPALADDCRTMIQKHLDNINDYNHGFVRATVSIHQYQGVGNTGTAGQVNYANGDLYKTKNMLSGIIPGLENTITWRPVVPGVCSGGLCGTPPEQPFAPQTYLAYDLRVTNTGMVSIQTLINGKKFLGVGPDVFQGVCSFNMITGIVANKTSNAKAYAITFKNLYPPKIH